MFTMCEYAKLIVPTGSRPGRAGICRGVGTDGLRDEEAGTVTVVCMRVRPVAQHSVLFP